MPFYDRIIPNHVTFELNVMDLIKPLKCMIIFIQINGVQLRDGREKYNSLLILAVHGGVAYQYNIIILLYNKIVLLDPIY